MSHPATPQHVDACDACCDGLMLFALAHGQAISGGAPHCPDWQLPLTRVTLDAWLAVGSPSHASQLAALP